MNLRTLLLGSGVWVAALALAACDDKATAPAGPAAPTAPANPAAPATPAVTPAAPPANAAHARIADIVGTWVVDEAATRLAMNDAAKVQLLQGGGGGVQYTEEQLKQAIELALDNLKRSPLETEIKGDGTYMARSAALNLPLRGTLSAADDVFTLIPDDQTSVARLKLVDGKLVTQRPRDPAAMFVALVWKRK